jgi:hypothetical protein
VPTPVLIQSFTAGKKINRILIRAFLTWLVVVVALVLIYWAIASG